LILPWLLGTLGAPVFLTGLLVPIREAGVLLPQLAVAALVRRRPKRKGVWLLGAVLSSAALALMALVVGRLEGAAAGWAIVGLLVVFSLARGLCSVSAKDVLGKTVSKSRRGVLMGWSASLGGLAVLGIGLALGLVELARAGTGSFTWLLAGGALLWLLAALSFAAIREEPGATEGGGNALRVALESLALLRTDLAFRRFVFARLLLLAVALAQPFYILLAQEFTGGGLAGLGGMIVATGIGAALSSPLWGKLGDRSSRGAMAWAAAAHGVLALLVWGLVRSEAELLKDPYFWGGVILVLTVLHSGARLGRKVYLVDMATSETRARYVAVSNTVLGVAMLGAGVVGLLGDLFGPQLLVLLLGLVSFIAAGYARNLPEVSEPG
jgi:hypothetical protein